MRVFGIAGHSGMGKTTLLGRVLPKLQARGLTVSLIKHSHKDLDIDRPGKDSYANCVRSLHLCRLGDGCTELAFCCQLEDDFGQFEIGISVMTIK